MEPITGIRGRGIPLRGNDIDTDRIMPARFLKSVSFEGLERHLFEDDRAADPRHSFNDPRYRGAMVLIVNSNFGCGSSREHAPQGLARAGIRAIVGESFSEIFRGNAAMIGVPCLVASPESVDTLQTLAEEQPGAIFAIDIAAERVTVSGIEVKESGVRSQESGGRRQEAGDRKAVLLTATLPAPLREAFLTGQWNPTAMLLERFEEVIAVERRLRY